MSAPNLLMEPVQYSVYPGCIAGNGSKIFQQEAATTADNSSNSALASFRSAVSKPSV
jgi:hypothetical protein